MATDWNQDEHNNVHVYSSLQRMEERSLTRSLVRQYFFAGYTYSEIILILFCQHGIYISLRHLHRLLRSEGLRRHAVWDEQVSIAIQRELEGSGSCLGYRSMARRLLTRHGITASREHVADLLRRHDPVGVSMRRTHHFSRRTYTSKGPNFLVHIDGYDKLKRYGFAIHGAVCGFSRRVLWLNVAHTNNNPSVVASYFMKFIKEIKGVPRCIRIDAGTENVLIADIQKAFRWDDDDNMAGEQSIICGSSHSNQRIERWWLSGKQGGCQFWIDLFRDMEMAGLLSTGNPVHIECARVCFMDLLQEELNQIQTEWNQHHVRFSNTSDSPSGKPDLMYYLPVLYSTVDYKVPKRSEDISAINCFCDNRGASEHQQIVNYRAGIGARNKPQTVEEALLLYGELLDHFA